MDYKEIENLEPMSKLWTKEKYTDDNISYIINNTIIEYDMKSAGLNMTKEFNLLPEEDRYLIERWEQMPKKQRNVAIGVYERDHPEFKKAKNASFARARRLFFIANNIEDHEVLSIKKDAIFLLREADNLEFGAIKFVPKNEYSDYIILNGIEVYYDKGRIDIKGIGDDILYRHRNGWLSALAYIFNKMKLTNGKEEVALFLKDLMYEYKTLDLPIDFYREFNKSSTYLSNLIFNGKAVEYMDLPEEVTIYDLNINYNLLSVLIPLINIVL